MKKSFMVIISVIVICVFSYIFIQIKYGWHIWIFRRIEIFIPFSAKVEYTDNHGGFHGDGECLVKVKFSEQQAQKTKEKIEKNNHWKKMPMPDKLNKITGARIDKNLYIPLVENGYYFFLDRNSEADDKYNPYEMYEEFRASSNYTIAVFDTNENLMYYYEFDT